MLISNIDLDPETFFEGSTQAPGESLNDYTERVAALIGIDSETLNNPCHVPVSELDPSDTRGHVESRISVPLLLVIYGHLGEVYCKNCFALRRNCWKTDCPYAPKESAAQEQLVEAFTEE